jgi:uncharacterized membrane protein YfcA
MIVFAFLMIATSVSMIRKSKKIKEAKKLTFGLLWVNNRFLGAGGGFFIPALLFFANLPMKQAVGTSLFIIFINSLIGFGGDLIGGVELNYKLLFIISAMLFLGLSELKYPKKLMEQN